MSAGEDHDGAVPAVAEGSADAASPVPENPKLNPGQWLVENRRLIDGAIGLAAVAGWINLLLQGGSPLAEAVLFGVAAVEACACAAGFSDEAEKTPGHPVTEIGFRAAAAAFVAVVGTIVASFAYQQEPQKIVEAALQYQNCPDVGQKDDFKIDHGGVVHATVGPGRYTFENVYYDGKKTQDVYRGDFTVDVKASIPRQDFITGKYAQMEWSTTNQLSSDGCTMPDSYVPAGRTVTPVVIVPKAG